IRVKIFGVQFGGERRITVEQILGANKALLIAEVDHSDVVLQPFRDLDGLVREAELLVVRGVPRLVVAVGQEVDGREHADHYQRVNRRIPCVFRRSRFRPVSSHVRTSTAAIRAIAKSGTAQEKSGRSRKLCPSTTRGLLRSYRSE